MNSIQSCQLAEDTLAASGRRRVLNAGHVAQVPNGSLRQLLGQVGDQSRARAGLLKQYALLLLADAAGDPGVGVCQPGVCRRIAGAQLAGYIVLHSQSSFFELADDFFFE